MTSLQYHVTMNVLLGSVCLYLVTLLANADNGCPVGLPDTTTIEQFQGKCYQFVNTEEYWTDARDYCWKHGGGLVMINTREINDFITGVLSGLSWTNNGIWIGLNDKGIELVWKWVTNSQYNFIPLDNSWKNWAKGHPEGFWHNARDCIRIVRGENWKWSETPCSTFGWTYRFICQYDLLSTTYLPGPVVGEIIGSAGTSTTNKEETDPQTSSNLDFIHSSTTIDNMSHVKSIVTDVEKQHLSAASAGDKEKETAKKIAIIAGAVGAALFVLFLIFIIVISRSRNKKEAKAFTENPMYEIPTEPKGVNTIANHNQHHTRKLNLYVESEKNPVKQTSYSHNMDGYLEPKSLMKPVNIADGYLTTMEAKQSDEYVKPSDVIHEPCMFIEHSSQEKPCNSAGYLPMNGSSEKLNVKTEKDCQSALCLNDYENPKGGGEPIYAEIPEIAETNISKSVN